MWKSTEALAAELDEAAEVGIDASTLQEVEETVESAAEALITMKVRGSQEGPRSREADHHRCQEQECWKEAEEQLLRLRAARSLGRRLQMSTSWTAIWKEEAGEACPDC